MDPRRNLILINDWERLFGHGFVEEIAQRFPAVFARVEDQQAVGGDLGADVGVMARVAFFQRGAVVFIVFGPDAQGTAEEGDEVAFVVLRE